MMTFNLTLDQDYLVFLRYLLYFYLQFQPNVRRSMANPGGPMGPMPPLPPQQQGVPQIYDAPNCDYDPPSYMQQNFGNPYDCPEGMYNGSMMSSVGYSQVSFKSHAHIFFFQN